VVLATGGDTGFIKPKGCSGRMGGALYRPAFTEWLRAAEPGVHALWVSTGNLVDTTITALASLPEMIAFYGTVPYAAVAVGRFDLEAVGAEGIAAAAKSAPFPLLAANLRVLETGRPLVEEAAVFDTPSGRIAFVGVLAHDRTAAWGGPRTGTVVTVDPREVVPALVARLKAEGSRVVLVSNVGYVELVELLRAAPGVDAAVASNGSTISFRPEAGFDAPTLWVGLLGQQLARLAFDRTGALLEASAQTVEGAFPIDPLTGNP
jgi:2',3'-cyclic-nucleotide 2'-phosphodiesterase (5'-nucleotidase family)